MANITITTNFHDALQELPIPWLFGGPVGQAEAGALGDVLDGQVDQLRQATKARMPTIGPVDALPHIANDRQLVQGPSESAQAFALRLQCADQQWQYAGSALSILFSLYYQGLAPYALLVQQNGLAFQLTGSLPTFIAGQPWDPTGNLTITNLSTNPLLEATPQPWWTFDLRDYFCSRFALLFPTLPPSWTNVVSPATPSTSPTLSQVNVIRSILRSWAKGSATCVGIYVVTVGRTLGWPVSTLGTAGSPGSPSSNVVVFTP